MTNARGWPRPQKLQKPSLQAPPGIMTREVNVRPRSVSQSNMKRAKAWEPSNVEAIPWALTMPATCRSHEACRWWATSDRIKPRFLQLGIANEDHWLTACSWLEIPHEVVFILFSLLAFARTTSQEPQFMRQPCLSLKRSKRDLSKTGLQT